MNIKNINQQTLDGGILYHNNSSSGIYLKLWKRKDDHIWRILMYFYGIPTDIPPVWSVARLRKLMLRNGQHPGINTIPNCIRRLKEEGMLNLIAKGVGVKRREKIYRITEKGERQYELYLDSVNTKK